MMEYSSMVYWQITGFLCFVSAFYPLKTHGVSNSSLKAFLFQDPACCALHPMLCRVYKTHYQVVTTADALLPACDILIGA